MTHTSAGSVFRADYSINSVTTSDSGTYTCNVTNPIGSDSETITVAIIGMPECVIHVITLHKDASTYHL